MYEQQKLDEISAELALFCGLPIFQLLNGKDKNYANKAKSLYLYAKDYLSHIPSNELFVGYTDHTINHSLAVLKYMSDIITLPNDKYGESLSGKTLFILIAVALLHDTGMVVSTVEEDSYLSGKNTDKDVFNIEQILSFSKLQGAEKEREAKRLLSIYLRKNHGSRSHDIILNKMTEERYITEKPGSIREIIGDYTLAETIAIICQSHCESYESLYDKFENYPTDRPSFMFAAALLRIADILDIGAERVKEQDCANRGITERDENISFWELNKAIKELSIKTSTSLARLVFEVRTVPYEEFAQWDINKNASNTQKKAHFFNVQSDIVHYFSTVKTEIETVRDFYWNKVNFPPDTTDEDKNEWNACKSIIKWLTSTIRFVPTPQYDSHTIGIDYKTVLNNLLGTGLYGENKIGLREIVQNSIDAIKWRKSFCPDISDKCRILIEISKANDTVIIRDTGIGMSKDTIVNCLLGIGKSIYSTDTYTLNNHQFSNIGRFGIGFFAIFMLCESVTINSKYSGGKVISVTANATSPNYFSESTDEVDFLNKRTSGTEVILHGIAKFQEAFAPYIDKDQPDKSERCCGEAVRHYLELIFLNDNNCNIEIQIFDEDYAGGTQPIICDIPQLDSGSIGYAYDNNIAETLIKYSKKTINSLFQWNGKTFEKIEDWHKLEFCDSEETVTICTVTDFDSKKLTLFYVPNKFDMDPFQLGIDDYRQRVFYKGDFFVLDYTTDKLMEDTHINPIVVDKNYFIAIIEKMHFKDICGKTLLYKKNAFFEKNDLLSAIKSGRVYADKVYLRNVLIPNAHLRPPVTILGYDGVFANDVEGIYINLLNKNVEPTIKRDALETSSLEKASKMISELLVRKSNLFDSLGDDKEFAINKVLAIK